MTRTKLNEAWTQPRVAVLDDKKHEVAYLIKNLRADGYYVDAFTKRDEFVAAVRDKVYPIQLIDVALGGVSDRDGFSVAAECALLHPEALRICISTILGNIAVADVLDALNPRKDISLPLSLPTSLGVRNLWAIYDKHKDTQALRKFIEQYRTTIGCGDRTEIRVDDELRQDFEDGFQGIRWDAAGVTTLPQVQFVEIVRQLARRAGMPPVGRVSLTKLGKGRSKTVVAHMRIEFEAKSRDADTHKERESLIKIGLQESIAREVNNYSEYLPQIFGSTFYPNIEASGVSLGLAGVAYSCLSDAKRDIAPTLLDALYGKVAAVSPDVARGRLREVFGYRRERSLMLSSADPQGRGEKLHAAYLRRFKELDVPSRRLDPTLKEMNRWLVEQRIIADEGGQHVFRFGDAVYPTADSVGQLTSHHAEWDDFYVDLVHGDMHLDNVLILNPSATSANWTNFYIDFADTGPHHVMLDYVVMDVALRFQSVKFLPQALDPATEAALARVLCEGELALASGAAAPGPAPAALGPFREWLARTWEIAWEVRRQAEAYLTNDFPSSVDSSGGTATEKAEEERQRFYCGIGLTALAAMHLRQPADVVRLHRAWFACIGQVYMSLFNAWKGSKESLA